jgi:hypothetical protein
MLTSVDLLLLPDIDVPGLGVENYHTVQTRSPVDTLLTPSWIEGSIDALRDFLWHEGCGK